MNFVVKNIPQGWTLKKMPDVVKWGSGGTPKATEKAFYENGTIPWLIIGDLNDGIVQDSASKITELGLQNSSAKMIPVGTLLVAMYGSIGKLGITGIECCTNQAIAYAKELKGVSTKYMYYYMAMMKSYLISQGKGGTQKNISQTVLNSLDVLVPPEKEQKRIVNRIEELFSELDSAVETLKKIKEQLAVYRQAVLKDAFEGRLTECFRDDEKDSTQADFLKIYRPEEKFKDVAGDENELQLQMPAKWKKVRVGEIFEVCVGGTPRRNEPSFWNGSVCWVSSGEVRFNKIFETKERITDIGVENSSAKIRPKGSVLLAMIGEGKTRGQAAILEVPAAHNQNTASILVSETPCSPLYLYYFLTLNYDHTRRVGSGNNQKALNKDRIKALHIPFCSFEEQKQIVVQIESRLSVCDNIEKTVNESLSQADAMRQSILKKAFEGGL